jgi:predicted CXXCH cytochrome family protein
MHSGRFNCLDCHRVHDSVKPGLLREKPGGASRRCSDCHREVAQVNETVHNPKGLEEACLGCHVPFFSSDSQPLLWGLALGPGGNPAERRCRACHAPDNAYAAQPVHVASHPGDPVPSRPEAGTLASVEEITCVTCHDPHVRGAAQLKPDVPGSVCAACHGPESLWLFLNYHQEVRTFPR